MIEKVRAPSGIEFHEGLGWGDGAQLGTSQRLPAEEVVLATDDEKQADAHESDVEESAVVHSSLGNEPTDQVTSDEAGTKYGEIHCLPSSKALFSTALLPQRLSVSCDSDNVLNVAYYSVKVKPNKKSAPLLFYGLNPMNSMIKNSSFFLVRMGGLEPPRVSPHGSKPCAFTSLATSAKMVLQ